MAEHKSSDGGVSHEDGAAFVVVYTTFPDEKAAVAAAEALVTAGLVACANILPVMTSVFIWEGRLGREREAAMLLKTRRELAGDVTSAIKRLHTYETPAVVVWPLIEGSSDYFRWIETQTAHPSPIVR